MPNYVRALLEQMVSDWPQVGTDEDMNGVEAVDALVFYITRAKELLAAHKED